MKSRPSYEDNWYFLHCEEGCRNFSFLHFHLKLWLPFIFHFNCRIPCSKTLYFKKGNVENKWKFDILEQNQTFSVRPFSWNSTFCIKSGLQWTYFTILASKQGSILQRMYFHQFRGNFTKFAEFRNLSSKNRQFFDFSALH